MRLTFFPILTIASLYLAIALNSLAGLSSQKIETIGTSAMLSAPFLQLPTENSIRVVWFTKFPGSNHRVVYGEKLNRISPATTIQLSRVREDEESNSVHSYQQTTKRDIWRHEAIVSDLSENKSIPYQVISRRDRQGKAEEISSRVFTLAPQPQPGVPLKILLTSDHQLKPMTAANLQKVAETIGRVDAIFFAGDLVNIPDRASEWFDDTRGGAFFFPVFKVELITNWRKMG